MILRHNKSERIVRFRRTVRFRRAVHFRRTLRKPIGNAPPTVMLKKKTYVLPKRNGKFFLAPTVGLARTRDKDRIARGSGRSRGRGRTS